MSDKIKKLTNQVTLTGKIAEIEAKFGKTKEKSVPYVSIKGAIQFGNNKSQTRKFETYVQLTNKEGKESKLYDPTVAFAKNAKSIAKHGSDEATVVSIQGSFEANDYVNAKEMLIEGLKIKATFFNDATIDDEFKGVADIEGYIQSIFPETKGEDEVETGRLRVNLLTTDFFGNIVPVKNIIVPETLKEAFENGYSEGQTATFFVDFIANQSEPKVKQTGGLGVQRETDGKSYIEMVLTGADPAIDEDEDTAVKEEAVRIGLAERKAMLNEIKEKGYQGTKSSGGTTKSEGRNNMGSPSQNKPKPVEDDDDIPF